MKRVLDRLREFNVTLNTENCDFRKSQLLFLGLLIDASGVKPDPTSLDGSSKAPEPTDLKSLRSFLGLLSWFSKYVPRFTEKVEPLRIDVSNEKWYWSPVCSNVVAQLKKDLMNCDALAPFDSRLTTKVTTDTSVIGIGAVISQLDLSGNERIISIASRKLQPREKKYATVEKEALACKWAVEKFHTWLWQRRVILCTDHQSLVTLLQKGDNSRGGLRISRWRSRLLAYRFDVQYKKGKENISADGLSRLPIENFQEEEEDDEEMVAAIINELPALTRD